MKSVIGSGYNIRSKAAVTAEVTKSLILRRNALLLMAAPSAVIRVDKAASLTQSITLWITRMIVACLNSPAVKPSAQMRRALSIGSNFDSD